MDSVGLSCLTNLVDWITLFMIYLLFSLRCFYKRSGNNVNNIFTPTQFKDCLVWYN